MNQESSLQPQECESDVSADHFRVEQMESVCTSKKKKKKSNAFKYLEKLIFCWWGLVTWLWNLGPNLRFFAQKGSISLCGTPRPLRDL